MPLQALHRGSSTKDRKGSALPGTFILVGGWQIASTFEPYQLYRKAFASQPGTCKKDAA